ncbi:MAG: type II toxin-antitoxin system tRNA(fMet)-specific endonuclease VapC [bacterium]
MRFLLDTNICIYIIKRKPFQVINKLRTFNISDIGISSITLSELEYGVVKSSRSDQNRDALINFLAPLEIIPYDDRAASHYGEIRAHLERIGQPIGAMDMLIAAHARSLAVTLVTNNSREFERVPQLQLENWVR